MSELSDQLKNKQDGILVFRLLVASFRSRLLVIFMLLLSRAQTSLLLSFDEYTIQDGYGCPCGEVAAVWQ